MHVYPEDKTTHSETSWDPAVNGHVCRASTGHPGLNSCNGACAENVWTLDGAVVQKMAKPSVTLQLLWMVWANGLKFLVGWFETFSFEVFFFKLTSTPPNIHLFTKKHIWKMSRWLMEITYKKTSSQKCTIGHFQGFQVDTNPKRSRAILSIGSVQGLEPQGMPGRPHRFGSVLLKLHLLMRPWDMVGRPTPPCVFSNSQRNLILKPGKCWENSICVAFFYFPFWGIMTQEIKNHANVWWVLMGFLLNGAFWGWVGQYKAGSLIPSNTVQAFLRFQGKQQQQNPRRCSSFHRVLDVPKCSILRSDPFFSSQIAPMALFSFISASVKPQVEGSHGAF